MNLRTTLILLSLCASCAEDGLVGEGPRQGSVSGANEVSGSCLEARTFDSIPASLGRGVESPSILVERARGSFVSNTAETLDVRITNTATLIEDRCESEVKQELQLMATVSLRSDGGLWNETMPLTLSMRFSNDGRVDLAGSAEISLGDVKGTFVLPNTPNDAADRVEMAFQFRDGVWILDRTVRSATEPSSAVWSAPRLRFERAKNI